MLVWYDAGVQAFLHSMETGSEAAVFGMFGGSWNTAEKAAGAFWSVRQPQPPARDLCKGSIAFAATSADETEWAEASAASMTLLRLFVEIAGMTPFWQHIERQV